MPLTEHKGNMKGLCIIELSWKMKLQKYNLILLSNYKIFLHNFHILFYLIEIVQKYWSYLKTRKCKSFKERLLTCKKVALFVYFNTMNW